MATCVGPDVGGGVAAGTDRAAAGVDATEREGAGGDELAAAAHPDATSASKRALIPIVRGRRVQDRWAWRGKGVSFPGCLTGWSGREALNRGQCVVGGGPARDDRAW